MNKLLKVWGVLVFSAGILFTSFQMYLERRIGSIEMKGHAWELAGPKTTNDLAIKWALTELAPCYDLDGFYYLPKNMYSGDYLKPKIDEFIEGRTENWLTCRYGSFSFSRAVIQDFSFVDGLFCPSNKSEQQSIMDFIYYKRRGLSISNSYFLCVSFSHSRLAEMSDKNSFFVGSSFLDADLSYSKWNGSDLRHTVFDQANLRGAQFRNVKLQGASFERANLCGAKFEEASLNGREDFEGADVTGADLASLSALTEWQLKQFCVRPDGSAPALPSHLAGKEPLIQKCAASGKEPSDSRC